MRRALSIIGLLFLIFLAAPYAIIAVLGSLDPPAAYAYLDLVVPAETQIRQNFVYAQTEISDEFNEFERYLIGVVAAEMPALFHIEALKAQAVASRTYAIYSMMHLDMYEFDYLRIGEIWQAYISEIEMRRRWGNDFDTHFATISNAVNSTRGEILIYDGEPIVAVFHAFSGGMTEYSGNVWAEQRPYLRSVDSSFYRYRSDFESIAEFSGNEFISLLRREFPDIVFDGGDIALQIVINERSGAGYVTRITIGNKVMDGALLRRLLGLRSTNFTIHRELDKIVFRVRGYGHGAGMSQVGAHSLAMMGYNYIDILKHYYSGAQITRYEG
ncbi:MAG: stage II sporulation protein D [Defluviitaleaceae bacterium]|nr:stage II sporulation protein D [Defluviitaleaceae bacterium]